MTLHNHIQKRQLEFFNQLNTSIPTGKYSAPKWNMKNAQRAFMAMGMNELKKECDSNNKSENVLGRNMRLMAIQKGLKAFLKYGYTINDISKITTIPYATVKYHDNKINNKEPIKHNPNYIFSIENNELKATKQKGYKA